ncbi:MAG: methylenetetrahydrofolate--tRNA-(uracil(54)-C(5))-methyltransferase (FADH(2)-oxidizing) TrmFO [Thermoanaerobaculales bacterium]|nr:methylenetetrahydrofolate--tRNA-(uracil(54)-C(5))-methyltransferase (FADH(2)-oxidizing) TrmFO [Thermoanaerobaculales bacterium]
MKTPEVVVVGGGLAGSEAAWQLARAGVPVRLLEMRPLRPTPVHTTDRLAELVCSNSLRGDAPTNAVGLLKREMASLDSLVIRCARSAAVPAGGALAVDRKAFSRAVTTAVEEHPAITLQRRELTTLPAGPAIIATGPLTSLALHGELERLLGEGALAFFDAVAPIVADDSIDHTRTFRASRWGKGGDDYLNIPLDRAAYDDFVAGILGAEKVAFKDFEAADLRYFEGCLPIEVMAERGPETLRYGPMKPVGLVDPATGKRPWAVIQLRQDDLAAEHWNMVGFQTKLTHAEQKRLFRTLPGLESARFVRLGMIHRNTFVNAPAHLDPQLRVRVRPDLRLAGQMTGVEGYVESAATGLIAARSLAAEFAGRKASAPPLTTALGGLVRHLTARSAETFQPSNITWGLIACPPELRAIRNKSERRLAQSEHAVAEASVWAASLE